jgi:hypothetical protein
VGLTRQLDGLAEQREIEEELLAPTQVEVGEVAHGWVVRQQQGVAGEVLGVADDGESAAHASHDERILASKCLADAVSLLQAYERGRVFSGS